MLREVVSEAQDGGLRAIVKVDRETAGRLGVSMQAINDALNDAFGQRQISTIYAQANQYRVVLEAMPQYQSDPDAALTELYVPASARRAGAAERRRWPRSSVARRRWPSTTRTSFPRSPSASTWRRARRSSDAVACDHARRSARSACPPRSPAAIRGDADEFTRSLAGQPWLILAAVITIYIVLGVLYESFVHPFTILTTLPSAGIGALLALMYCGHGPVDGRR